MIGRHEEIFWDRRNRIHIYNLWYLNYQLLDEMKGRGNILKETFIEKIKWKNIKWKSSIYTICACIFIISVIAIIFICISFSSDSLVYSLGNSIFTGIIASIIVAVIIQIKQDKSEFEKKRAILFDAGFYLICFQKQYSEKKIVNNKLDEDWKQIFLLCEKPAEYLIELYKSGVDVLDIVDISIIRKINSNYKFILNLSKSISVNSKDEEFLRDSGEVMDIWDKYNHMVTELKENLFFLLIKWKKDSIID